MDSFKLVLALGATAPALLMLVAALLPWLSGLSDARLAQAFGWLSLAALGCIVAAACSGALGSVLQPWLSSSALGLAMAALVQLMGSVIAAFSSRYLEGEPGRRRYLSALAAVLAAVHVLLLADHWLVLIAAWALVGVALQPLLCFYPDRPFARLAAHKKRIADRLADGLLIAAAGLAWWAVGSGSLSTLYLHLARDAGSPALQASAVLLVLAVVLRTALLPVHGWLIQVMEAPTPVSALLHAGVVNLGGFVLIRFAPLLEQAPLARWLLLGFGLGTAVLAGLVMLTRISIKVRLAWSTLAQMGFMVLECGLGLYSLAALHLIGHSLYKAHAFLSASTIVRQTRLQTLRGTTPPRPLSLWLAPLLAVPMVWLLVLALGPAAWPWWWSVVLGLAWAPLLWLQQPHGTSWRTTGLQGAAGLAMVGVLTALALLAHALPFGLADAPQQTQGLVAMLGMAALYLCLVLLQLRPEALSVWRRWSYAGFYVDEVYTRLALRLWPARWTPEPVRPAVRLPAALAQLDTGA